MEMGTMSRPAILLYGVVVYCLFLLTFLYAIGFVAAIPLPKTVDSGTPWPLAASVCLDLALLSLFAVQHSVMARPAFKRWWTRFIPQEVERTTYVLFASAVLILLFWGWRPIPLLVWHVTEPAGALILEVISSAGWALVLLSTFAISHFELFGLQQVYHAWRGKALPAQEFRTPTLYKVVRHPIYLGFLLAFWATPVMTVGHLLFAAATAGYILIGIQLEERDLVTAFGNRYRQYRQQVPMLLPSVRRRTPLVEAPPPE
jgi:protein-S-isoprenylcysteine O-methyltransferase Ste14